LEEEMNRTAKIVIGLFSALILLGLAGGGLSIFLLRSIGNSIANMVNNDPSSVRQVAVSIVEFDVPTGFTEEYSITKGSFKAAAYKRNDGQSHLYLMQGSEDMRLDQSTVDGMAKSSLTRAFDNTSRQSVVDQFKINIRGTMANIVITEGVNSEGNSYKSLSAVFQGEEGPTLINLTQPGENWNQDEINRFLASIK
jgi:hypothetical protein